MAGRPLTGRNSANPKQSNVAKFFNKEPVMAHVPLRDRAYLQNRINGMSPKEAYQAAGYPVDHINPIQQAAQAERRVMHSEWVRELADKYGLNEAVFMYKLSEQLDATTQKEYKTRDDEIISGEERVDWRARADALGKLGNMLHLTREVPEQNVPSTVNTINILQIGERYKELSPQQLLERMQNNLLGVKTQEVAILPVDDDGGLDL
jgi:hypothetical protein